MSSSILLTLVQDLCMLLCFALVTGLCRKLLLKIRRHREFLEQVRSVPGLQGTSLILGDMRSPLPIDYLGAATDIVQTTRCSLHKVWMYFMYPIISLDHPDTAKVLLQTRAPKPTSVGCPYTMLKPWIGDGLLTLPGGAPWKRRRRLLTPAYHWDALRHYVAEFNDAADDLMITLAKFGTDNSIEIVKPVTVATIDALLRCAFSYNDDLYETSADHPYVTTVHRLSELFHRRLSNPILYPGFIFWRTTVGREFKSLCQFLHQIVGDIIARRVESLKCDSAAEAEDDIHDFLDAVLAARDDSGVGLTHSEVLAEINTFLFAGQDTTCAAISWAIYRLAKHPMCQSAVHDEVVNVAGDRQIDWEDLISLPYTTAFIKEVMRMHSVVPLIGRHIDEPMIFDGYRIPSNTYVEVNIHAMNHHPDVWPDHELFRPERFTESGRDTFSFIPFSAGPRNCIGQNFAMYQLKVILCRLVQMFQISLDSTHEIGENPILCMKPKHGIKVFLHKRY